MVTPTIETRGGRMSAVLVRGANAPLGAAGGTAPPLVRLEVAWSGRTTVPVSLTAVACDARGQALGPDHHVTYERPTGTPGGGRFEVAMDLAAVPEEISTVAYALTAEGGSLESLTDVVATVRAAGGTELAQYPVDGMPSAAGLVIAEIYRRSGQWKVRAVGQGSVQGRAALLRAFGLA